MSIVTNINNTKIVCNSICKKNNEKCKNNYNPTSDGNYILGIGKVPQSVRIFRWKHDNLQWIPFSVRLK